MRDGQRAQARRLTLSLSAKSYASLSPCLCRAERTTLHPVDRVVVLLTWALKGGTQAGRSGEEGRKGKGSGCWLLASGPQCASSHLRGPRNRILVGEVRTYIPLPSDIFRDRNQPVCAFPLPGMRQH
ncbi:hypothetical protein D0864_12938 [Hortaea werneckii]|uniref:Uncharacterized protein n=1 Tax=Hortaea werneckii TaxID=91943 RepID=A0A3M7DBJ6_HORWE|nr:hypothetical protein D0864_12938 [Hortaea werneckii]